MTPPDVGWRLSRLLAAPHRLAFVAGAGVFAASGLWWLGVLLARPAGLPVPWAVPPLVAHGLWWTLGFMPLFIVGFLFTAGPRWLGLPDVDARTLRWPVSAMVAGWVLALPGWHLAAPLAAAGLLLVAAGWAALLVHFTMLLRRSPAPDRLHATLVAASGGVGLLAMALAVWSLGHRDVTLARVATQLALWGFIAPTFAVVSHRMLPFFTASALPGHTAWRPGWVLTALLAVLGVQGAGAIAGLLGLPPPAPLQAAVEAPAALLCLWLAWRWGFVQSRSNRLLAMLHAGFVWLGLATALAAASHALQAASGGERSLGLAPLHALTAGYLGATLLAMVTRVSAGHSGRPLAADGIAWGLYWALQAAAVLRVAAALWPAAEALLTPLAALAWALAACGWTLRYGGWLGRPRVDGRPG
ncbi:MAG: NnrS family protein [Rubrivivax sp.]|nr:NnrS family protein [Rubrivivax sp.]